MKKALKSIAFALITAALAFNFAACASDDDNNDGGNNGGASKKSATLPKIEGDNPLSGNTYELVKYDGEITTMSFSSDSFTVKSSAAGNSDYYFTTTDFKEKSEATYKYVVDSENGMLYYTETSRKITYVDKDGKTLYTKTSTVPSSYSAWKNERIKEIKAILPSEVKGAVTDEYLEKYATYSNYSTFKEYGYTDPTCKEPVSDEIYKKYYTAMTLPNPINEDAFLIDGDTFKRYTLSEKDIFPAGTKISNIFNDYYKCFIYNFGPDITLRVDSNTRLDKNVNLKLDSKNYKILSADDEKLVLTEITKLNKIAEWASYYTSIEYDANNKIEVPVTYEEGENKVTAKLTVDGTEYSLDINYFTKEKSESWLRYNGSEFTKK